MMAKNFAFDKVKNKINGIFDFGNSDKSYLDAEFIKLSLDYDKTVLSRIIQEYEQLSPVKINVQETIDAATFSRVSYFATSIANRKVGKSPFSEENLFYFKECVRES